MLSLDNFRLIVVICLITPSILQIEDRLASQDGLWDPFDLVIPHGKKRNNNINSSTSCAQSGSFLKIRNMFLNV